MEEIKNYTGYNERMSKSLLDKIFFIDKIEADVIIDYGCADGTLINFLSKLFPSMEYIGFDIDKDMLNLAESKCGEGNFFFTDNWDLVQNRIQKKKSAVVLSSVIHEVYAYGTRLDVDNVWKRVFGGTFDYVVIRDMVPSSSMSKRSDMNDIKNILRKGDSRQVRDFEQVWGSIEENRNLIHFLLKYRYTDNWDREVRENYFPISREELLSTVPDDYEIEFHEHFVLPYIKNTVREDFGINIKDNTHIKLILKKV